MKRNLLTLIAGILLFGTVSGQQATDTTVVYYHRGRSDLDLTLRNNRAALRGFLERFNIAVKDSTFRFVSLRLDAYSSPDGITTANKRLSENRAKRLSEYLRSQSGLSGQDIAVQGHGIDWEGLEAMVAVMDVPYKDEVLNLLHDTPEWIFDEKDRVVDGRKHRLGMLRGGVPYNYMMEHVFPLLRRSCITLSYTVEPSSEIQPQQPIERPTDEQPAVQPQQPHEEAIAQPEPTPTAASNSLARSNNTFSRWALKTNLLYDAVLMPSLEAEYHFADRWSLNLEGEVAWWSNRKKNRCYQLASVGPEVRYWFKTRERWHGHYAGVFGNGLWYDLSNGEPGYQGNAWMAGVSYGYMFPITRYLSLEAGLGLGFLHTRYESYTPHDGHNVYNQTRRTNYFGPVKLKFALVWRLGNASSGKGGLR